MADNSPPAFIESWLDDVKHIYREDGVWGLPPYFLIGFGVASGVAVYYVPDDFFASERWDVAATVYTGLLAFNALTLALAWGGIGRIYESITRTGFCSFLKNGGVLSTYLFYISFVHVTQVMAAFITLVSMVVLFLPLPSLTYDRVALALTLTGTLWALRWALGAVKIVQDLSWHYATYDNLGPEEKQQLRLAVSNDHT